MIRTALSIRQPWAWLIASGLKDIENRSWPTRFRGKILIHASKGMTRAEFGDAQFTVYYISQTKPFPSDIDIAIPPYGDLQRGGIVGEADLVDCVTDSASPWFFGDYGFVLKNARPLPFYPCRGQLGLFNIEYPNP